MVKVYTTGTKCKDLISELVVSPTSRPNYTFKNRVLRYIKLNYGWKYTILMQELLQVFHKSELGDHSIYIEREREQLIKEYTYYSIGRPRLPNQ